MISRQCGALGSKSLTTKYLDVDFAVPPRVSMKFVGAKTDEDDEFLRDTDELEIACK